jgi:predicted ATPase
MKLINLSLTNFKKISSIPKPTISFNSDINVLIGANNTGKTSILRAIQKIFRTERIDLATDANFLIKDGNLLMEAIITLTSEEWYPYLKVALGSSTISLTINLPDLAKKLDNLPIRLLHTVDIINRRQSNYQITGKIDSKLLEGKLADGEQILLTQLALNHFAQTEFFNVYKSPLYLDSKGQIQSAEKFIPLSQIKNSQPQNVNIRGLLYALKKDDPKRFEDFKSRLLAIFTELEDIDVLNNEESGFFELVLHEKLRRNGETEAVKYDITSVGQGMQSLVLMLSNILLLKPGIVLMDEPEVHMHPSLIKEFIKYIKLLAIDTQFVITTHSLVLMEEVGLDKLFSLKNEVE